MHGYHPAVEDGELYLPGIKKALDPALYPFNAQFFMSHARMTLFDELVAASVRISHLPLDYVVLLWHVACIFALLVGCWRVSRICFNSPLAPWGSVVLVASLLTIPVAGTALYIMDQYLTPRDFSTAGLMLVLADAMERRFWRAGLLILAIAAIHPLMSAFGIGLLVFLYIEKRRLAAPVAAPLLLFPLSLRPVSPIYREVLDTWQQYYLVVRWQWYEWLGIFAPLALLWGIARYGQSRGRLKIAALSRALVFFGLVSFAAALVVSLDIATMPIKSLGSAAGPHLPGHVPGAAPVVSRHRAFGIAEKIRRQFLGPGVRLGPQPHSPRRDLRDGPGLHGTGGRRRARLPRGGRAQLLGHHP